MGIQLQEDVPASTPYFLNDFGKNLWLSNGKNGQIVQEGKLEMRNLWAKKNEPTCLFSWLNFQLRTGFLLVCELKHVVLQNSFGVRS